MSSGRNGLERLMAELDKAIEQNTNIDCSALLEATPSHDDGDNAETSRRKEATAFRLGKAKDRRILAEEAKRRMTEGTYGICEECKEPIAAKRLAAVPWARYCIACQTLQDKGQLA
jgi:DnaK suppressor protein